VDENHTVEVWFQAAKWSYFYCNYVSVESDVWIHTNAYVNKHANWAHWLLVCVMTLKQISLVMLTQAGAITELWCLVAGSHSLLGSVLHIQGRKFYARSVFRFQCVKHSPSRQALPALMVQVCPVSCLMRRWFHWNIYAEVRSSAVKVCLLHYFFSMAAVRYINSNIPVTVCYQVVQGRNFFNNISNRLNDLFTLLLLCIEAI